MSEDMILSPEKVREIEARVRLELDAERKMEAQMRASMTAAYQAANPNMHVPATSSNYANQGQVHADLKQYLPVYVWQNARSKKELFEMEIQAIKAGKAPYHYLGGAEAHLKVLEKGLAELVA